MSIIARSGSKAKSEIRKMAKYLNLMPVDFRKNLFLLYSVSMRYKIRNKYFRAIEWDIFG